MLTKDSGVQQAILEVSRAPAGSLKVYNLFPLVKKRIVF